jgi:hypothetical protein
MASGNYSIKLEDEHSKEGLKISGVTLSKEKPVMTLEMPKLNSKDSSCSYRRLTDNT